MADTNECLVNSVWTNQMAELLTDMKRRRSATVSAKSWEGKRGRSFTQTESLDMRAAIVTFTAGMPMSRGIYRTAAGASDFFQILPRLQSVLIVVTGDDR